MKTKKNQLKLRHTIKVKKENTRISNKTKSCIVSTFLEILNTVKLYHWHTQNFAQHKATDELYAKLNKTIDRFVEVLLGKDSSRIKMVEKRIQLIDIHTTQKLKERIYEYRTFLIDISIYFSPTIDTDLLSIRDEILADLNQFLYLLTFN
jgi:DNA-binding ferritin-like protein